MCYGKEALLRLQQILLYRQLDMPLEKIKKIMGRRDFDGMSTLEGHKQELRKRIAQLERLVTTVDDMILHLKWKSYSAAEKQRIQDEGNAVYQDFLLAMPKGAASPEAQSCVEAWRRHMETFWTPNDEQLLGLANGYHDDPRFKANFDKIDPNLARFIREAVKAYVKKEK